MSRCGGMSIGKRSGTGMGDWRGKAMSREKQGDENRKMDRGCSVRPWGTELNAQKP